MRSMAAVLSFAFAIAAALPFAEATADGSSAARVAFAANATAGAGVDVQYALAVDPVMTFAEHPGGDRSRPAHDVVDAASAFDILKERLVGEWTGRIVHSSEPVEATFYLTGNDSAIVEYIRRPLKPKASMSTVYHLADDNLQLTHYCSFMNQPRLRATSVSQDGNVIDFSFIDVTNLARSGDRYTHRMRVAFPARGRASVSYIGLVEGEEAGDLTVELERASPSHPER